MIDENLGINRHGLGRWEEGEARRQICETYILEFGLD